MPAENRNSDASSLNWEEFFGSSNSEDLLPCLLNVYDSIAAARKLRSSLDGEEADTSDRHDTKSEEPVTPATERDKPSTPSRMVWCNFRDVSTPQSAGGCDLRPKSVASIASMSSRSSLSSSSSRSAGSSNSINPDTEESPDARTSPANEVGENLTNKSLRDSLVQIEDSTNQTKDLVAAATTQPRTSYATSSQYSEDSGIYSSLMRSESLHDRSWFCTDSEDFSYTNRVAVEILETELVYVNDLQQIITGYLDEWRNDGNCALSSDQINDLFGNIEEIYDFNRCFLWELEQCGLDPVKIASCFVENNSNFSIYAVYCTHYPRSMNILTELMRQEKTAHIFRERQISLHHTLPLGSYLLKPVQRILKYHLLLQNMVKHTSPDTIGYNDITVALSTMTGIAHHINTMKRRHEHAIRVQEVQSLLTGWQGPDLTTFGELYAEGSFRISGAKALRHIFLFEQMLLVTKKKEGGILNYKTHIVCSNLMLVECIPKELLNFQIIPFDNPRMQFTVHARSLEEKRHWTLELKRVILENYNVDIPSHARQLVMELGQIQQSDDVAVEKISPKRQHTPEYLQRRRGDKSKKAKMKSRLLPLFRKSDILLNNKMRSKLKKNHFVSEGSIFSDTSVNSDESYGNEASLQSLSKTTEDLSQRCDEMSRTLADMSKLSCGNDDGDCADPVSEIGSRDDLTECASNASDSIASGSGHSEADETSSSYQQKEKLIEEIIGQLLIASQKFQKAIKDHEHSMRAKRNKSCDSDVTETYRGTSFDTEDETEDETYTEETVPVLKYTKKSPTTGSDHGKDESWTSLNTSSESLSPSLNVLVPTCPNIWLRQQREHLATPQKKADSLPRTFQATTPADEQWRANRPKTIASDKPTRVKDIKQRYDNDDIVSNNCFLAARRKEIAGSLVSLHTTNVHPECKFYRTSVARMTLRKMVYTMGVKLLTKRSKSERFYKIDHDLPKKTVVSAAVATVIESQRHVPVYRQGSSDLGARIANGKEISDYADPKVLFPTITPSKKAASLLGIRVSPTKGESQQQLWPVDQDARSNRKDSGSDCSAESFYERKFEEVEADFENAIRETSILADSVNAERALEISESFKKYSQINLNISVHKTIRIPPPVPLKPAALRRRSSNPLPKHMDDRSSLSVAPVSLECSIPTRGWVKQVVQRFQSAD